MKIHKLSLNDLPARDGRTLERWCEHNPRVISIRECGDHVMVKGPKGTAVFPDRDMGTGLWEKAKKMLIAAGIAAFIGLCALVYNAPVLAGGLP